MQRKLSLASLLDTLVADNILPVNEKQSLLAPIKLDKSNDIVLNNIKVTASSGSEYFGMKVSFELKARSH